MSDEVELSVSVPLDSDGFLRRECPTCERELKWLPAQGERAEAEAAPVPDGGYYCPYCRIQSPPDAWLTKAQVEVVHGALMAEVVEPELKRFERSLKDTARRSGGFLEVSVDRDAPRDADPLVETDDMRRVDFDCHPGEPVKVLDDWSRDVHCLVCGTAAPTG